MSKRNKKPASSVQASRRRDKSEIHDPERTYRALVENSPDVIMNLDRHGTILFINHMLPKYTVENVIGTNVSNYLSAEDAVRFLQLLEKMFDSGEPQSLELDAAGPTRWLSRIFPIRRVRKIESALIMATDITERKRAEEVLQRFQFSVEHAPEGVFFMTRDAGFSYVNEQACRSLGYTRDELSRLKLWDIDPVYPKEQWKTIWTQGQKDQVGTLNLETLHRRKDGVVFPVEVSAKHLWLGDYEFHVAFVRDITERKQLEEQLRHAHKLEAVGQLTGGVAHEFNNLLTAITGNLALALGQLPPESDLHGLINPAQQAAGRAAGLTQQLLSFSRRTPVDLQPQNLGEGVKEVSRLLRQTIDRRIRMEIEVDVALWPVLADAAQMSQLVMNLCVNSRDALMERIERNTGAPASTDCEPRMLVRVENVQVDDAHCHAHPNAKRGHHVCLCVSDNGIGIEEEIRHRIFEPFFTTKGVGRGTGLGLSAVYGIVAAHQGWIELDSAKDEGTTFRVYFPRTDQTPILTPSPSSEKPATDGGKTILLIDDEEAIRLLGQTILEHKGYQVLMARDGREAIEIFSGKKEEIDLVILDLTMPHRSGGEVLRCLRQIEPKLKVIVSSGHRTDHAFDLTDVSFLPKPYRPDDLLRTVIDALQQG